MTPLLLGHRGTPRLHPENSLAGFQAALDAGLDGVELDVRRLGDGGLVICHDPQLKDGRKLDTLSRAELPAHVPLLPDVLAWAAESGAYLNVEIKPELGRGDGRVEETLDLIRAYGLAGQVIVSSFSPLQLLQAKQHAPSIERGFLYHRPYQIGCDLVLEVGRKLAVTALHPHFSLITPALMDTARREGWRVNTWTVNDAAEGRRLLELGVSGLIGDLPDVLLEAGREGRSASQSGEDRVR
ncbi:glycerophosphodiester phosphodiesterase [Deinococcus irradiatisoli]|uniref:Glycerophosphodiester phosphodiesterase n=1 Tax=Deinococcus irradiatisoli TaxID=2202254 RepID=A0A2Z3JMI6_9DEIO|nr:glycerophosphodiester phosphodiesterase [Deinococcus irradiatisoli]AWN22898.1 glycerophosphodiester phosphodiesterase [Deinococcus irradiatisoli]